MPSKLLSARVLGASPLVSHDRYFLDRVASSVLVLDGTGETAHVQGGYSNYEKWRSLSRKNRDTAAPEAPKPKGTSEAAPKPKKLTYAERIEYDKLMPRIEALGEELAQLEIALSDPDLYTTRRAEAGPLEAQRQAKKAEARSTRSPLAGAGRTARLKETRRVGRRKGGSGAGETRL